MTSKIVVNNIEPDAGISTVTVVGNVESTKFVGSVEGSVTGNVTGNLTGTASTSTNAATAYAIDNAASINTSGIVTATSFVPSQGQLSHRNLIINGDFQVAQRASSSNNNGYTSVDRWKIESSNITHNSTKSQQSLSSSDTPYTLGFRRFARIALAQAGVVAANSYVEFHHKMEAQNVSNSGWNYNSTSSFITLQFWFRCSTNQTFYAWVTSTDGTNKRFTFSFTASGNNAWTKVTKTIPGASGIQIDNDNGEGFNVVIAPFYGTDYTGSVSLDTWVTKNDATHSPDYASTWLTAGASTFDITGVQLEVGPVATPFEHRSFGEELQRCSRYYQKIVEGNAKAIDIAYSYNAQYADFVLQYPMGAMRAIPSLDQVTGADYYNYFTGTQGPNLDGVFILEHAMLTQANIYFDPDQGLTAAQSGYLRTHNNAAYLAITAEL